MTESLLAHLTTRVGDLRLLPSKGGVFEVMAGDRLIFSKKKENRYPTAEEILAALERL